jgi:hypothetical protein
MPTDLRRRDDIAAAVEARNSDNQRTPLLPPDAVRLLTAMFPRDEVCQRSLSSLVAEGFDGRTLPALLRALVDAGLLSKAGERGFPRTYRLHLPPRRQP